MDEQTKTMRVHWYRAALFFVPTSMNNKLDSLKILLELYLVIKPTLLTYYQRIYNNRI